MLGPLWLLYLAERGGVGGELAVNGMEERNTAQNATGRRQADDLALHTFGLREEGGDSPIAEARVDGLMAGVADTPLR